MNTKKTDKVEEVAAKPAPAAPKPLSKPQPAKAAKPVVKPAAKPAEKPAKPAPTVAAKDVSEQKATAKPAKEPKEAKVVKKTKLKVVRDSFTMPQSEYQKIAQIKEIGLKAGLQVKKSEVLRAGVIALCAMDEAQLKLALSGLDKIKTGRPNKH